MTTELSVATDLGALLRDSIDSGLNATAGESGNMPIQLSMPASGVQSILPTKDVAPRIPTPGEFSVVSPPSTARGVAVDVPAPVVTKTKRSPIVGMLLGAVALASVMGGGAAWYVHHHEAKMAAASAPVHVAVNDVPPPAAKEAPPAEVVAAPVVERAAEEPAAAPVVEAAKVEAPKPTKHAHRTATAPKVEAPKPAPKVEKPVVAEAPKPVAAPKPAAGGAVDAVLQQQLSGAIP